MQQSDACKWLQFPDMLKTGRYVYGTSVLRCDCKFVNMVMIAQHCVGDLDSVIGNVEAGIVQPV